MMDERLPADTLTILVEGYFRFYKEDCIGAEHWLPYTMQTQEEEKDEDDAGASSAAASSSAPWSRGAGAPSPPAKRAPARREIDRDIRPDGDEFGDYEGIHQLSRPYRRKYDAAAPELVDLVTTATQAHVAQCGDIIWFGYNGGSGPKARKPVVGFGRAGHLLHEEGGSSAEHGDERQHPSAFRHLVEADTCVELSVGASRPSDLEDKGRSAYRTHDDSAKSLLHLAPVGELQ